MDNAYARPTLRARELRLNATEAERLLWRHISAHKVAGARFNRQVPIGPFICDFVSRTEKLIIEVDGGQHDLNAEADARRTCYLEAQGYRVIRFWNNDVIGNIEGVVAAIEFALGEQPLPQPLLETGGE